MRVMLLGANGFIGSRVLGRLLADGHRVSAPVRDPERLKTRFPEVEAVRADLNRMLRPPDWRPLLQGIEAVVNCAGALQSGGGQSLRAIHLDAPLPLYRACVEAEVRRVVHLSAISANPEAGTEYARTKHAAEQSLKALDLDWAVVVALQIRARDLARAAIATGQPLPPGYDRLMCLWYGLGWPAFLALIAVFWLMVAKPGG